MAAVKPKDKLFGDKALELGYLSEGDLTKAYVELAADHSSHAGLRELLETQGLLTKEKSRAVERALSGGQQIAGYELLEKVGQGGMGAVFRARQISMDRIVALKILPPKLAKDKKFCERFIMEARASGGLNHINIIQGIDVGESQGHYYFAMEYVDGSTVKEILDEGGRLSEALALTICKQMADALDHANQNKLVHRDIKPDNIMLAGLPENWKEQPDPSKLTFIAKLCDLGLARSVSSADDMKGVAVGTPHFIAPEQARGETDVDTRADIYSLGASLYNMLTAKTLFTAKSSRDVMMMHLTDQAPDPNELPGVNVSENTLRIMEKMLAKDRNDRYENPKQLSEDLQQAIAGKRPPYTKGFNAKSSLALPAKLRKGESTGSVRAVRSGRSTTISGKHASVRSSATTDKFKKDNSKLFIFGGVGALIVGIGIAVVVMTSPPAVPTRPTTNTTAHNPGPGPTDPGTLLPPTTTPTPPEDGGRNNPEDTQPNTPTSIKEENEKIARDTYQKVMGQLGDDPAKNVTLLRENNHAVRAAKDLAPKYDKRLEEELEKWRGKLAEEWKQTHAEIDALTKQQRFESARGLIAKADPKFQEVQKLLADSNKAIDERERGAVDDAIQQATELGKQGKFPPALNLTDPDRKKEFSTDARKKFQDSFGRLETAYGLWQKVDNAANIDQREQLYEKAIQALQPEIAMVQKPKRVEVVRDILKKQAGDAANEPVAGWLHNDLHDAAAALQLIADAEAFLQKNPKTVLYRIGDDGKPVAAKFKSVKDGRIAFEGQGGDFPIDSALGSTQIARFGGAFDKNAPLTRLRGAALLATALGEYDKADALLTNLPSNESADGYRRLAILNKQPDDEKQIRRQLDAVTLLVEAAHFDEAQQKFEEVDAATATSTIGLKYAPRILELRTAIGAKGFGKATPAASPPPPPPPPPPADNTKPAAGDGPKPAPEGKGVNIVYYNNWDKLPEMPNWRENKPEGSVAMTYIDFHNKIGDLPIKPKMVVRMRGHLNLKSGRYQFRLMCNDGARLTVWPSGNFGAHITSEDMSNHTLRATEAQGIDLPEGNHNFSIDYFNNEGDGALVMQWIPPGGKDWVTVPPEVFTR